MPKIHDLASLLGVAEAEIPVNNTSDIQGLASAFVAGIVWGRDTQGSPDILFGLKINEVKRMVESALAWKEITLEDIRAVLEWHGRTLTDLGADYALEFLVWFRDNHKGIFDPWLEWVGTYLPLQSEIFDDTWIQVNQTKIADHLLFDLSNSLLGSPGISEETHDDLLIAFCKTCPKAKRHIHILLEQLKGEE